jgi:hypothetical protein
MWEEKMPDKKVSWGQWKDLGYAVAEARKIMKKHGFSVLPANDKLEKLGYWSLSSVIYKHHGGMRKFRQALGEENKRVAHGQWQDLVYTMEQAKRVMKENGFNALPSSRILKSMGEGSLTASIENYHGGFQKFRELLGQKQIKGDPSKLDDLGYVLKEVKKIMDEYELGMVPTFSQLKKLGYSSLAYGIMEHHGMSKIRSSLGQENERVGHGNWKDLGFTIQKAKEVIEKNELDFLPKSYELQRMGYTSLIAAISKYHGGFISFKEKFEEKTGISSLDRKQLERILNNYVNQ